MCRHLVLSMLPFSFSVILHCTVINSLSVDSEHLEDNYVDQLIAENYITNLMRKWKLTNIIPNTADATIYADLKGLYETLKYHPGLMERRLQVGSKSPPPLPKEPQTATMPLKKRSVFDLGLARPVCPFRTEWRLIHQAKDMNNSDVEVFQPSNNHSNQYQWFYTVSCNNDAMISEQHMCPFCCRGIHSRRFASMCITRKSYVMALVRKRNEINYDWNYIQVDSSCNCAISPAA